MHTETRGEVINIDVSCYQYKSQSGHKTYFMRMSLFVKKTKIFSVIQTLVIELKTLFCLIQLLKGQILCWINRVSNNDMAGAHLFPTDR
jgi:hypothetical protein